MRHSRIHILAGAAALLIIQFAPRLYGQEKSLGLTAGVNASQVDGDAYQGYNKLGLIFGGYYGHRLKYDFYWEAALKYVSRGTYKPMATDDPTLYRSSYHYLEIPLSVYYLYSKKVRFEAGTSPEVLLWTRFADQDGLIDRETYPDNRRLGLSVFAGVVYWFSTNTGVGIRYTYSAIPFRDPREWNHPRYRGYYHKSLSLTLSHSLRTD